MEMGQIASGWCPTLVECRIASSSGTWRHVVIVGNSGILLSRVVFTKATGGKSYIIQDAAMAVVKKAVGFAPSH